MRDTELYARILGVERPWRVSGVELRLEVGEVEVFVEHGGAGKLACPECGEPASRYDRRERRWRHLDTCQYRTILVAQVPRVKCSEHGAKTIRVPWAEPGSPFTALFEALVIDWLRAATTQGVARLLGLSWDQVDGVMQRAVRRGLARRELRAPRRVGVDETSFQRRHEYVTVVADAEQGVVHHVADGRGKDALASYYDGFEPAELARIQSVAMDMWGPYIAATVAALPDAEAKIAFDKFHVAMHLGAAVDRVRRAENRALRAQGDETLAGTRHLWLYHPDHLPVGQAARFEALLSKALKTSRAWMLKELAMEMWECRDRQEARAIFASWYTWAIRSRLAPMRRVASMIKRHLEGILNAIVARVTNARIEGLNTRIQHLKRSARGFRNRERFRHAIYFHLGGLDLYPAAVTHSHS
ncbi:MAG: ISL3 family transposase [Gemmatimonadales bacterium]